MAADQYLGRTHMRIDTLNLFKQACLVDGKWVQASDGSTLEVTNPFDESKIGTVPLFNAQDVQKAISAAEKAWPAWRDMTARERALPLRALYDLIVSNVDELAAILTMEQGKPLAEARGEILTGAEYFAWYAEEARRKYGHIIPHTGPGKQPLTFSQPIGVAALITPWNFPSSMLTRKMAAALAAGCAVVAKPASATPYSALAIGELALQAGIPAGVCNVITGKASVVGEALTSSPAVRALSFTGSTDVGKKLMAECAATVKKVSLELGGNAPYLVFSDADLDRAVQGLIACKFRNAGQTCICANRILVQKDIHDTFVEKLCAAASALAPGNGLVSGVTLGPLISRTAVEHMRALVDEAAADGAVIRLGGKRPAGLGPTFFEPTVLTGVTPSMRLCREEIFGPLAPIMTFESEAEAVSMANNTPYGLASYLFTRDVGRIWRVSRALDYGMVGVNEITMAACEVPFGGVKESGLGREGGMHGLEEYMETKYVLLGHLEQ